MRKLQKRATKGIVGKRNGECINKQTVHLHPSCVWRHVSVQIHHRQPRSHVDRVYVDEQDGDHQEVNDTSICISSQSDSMDAN